jgi:hypothetical protein
MTLSERNHQDSKVLLVGLICAMLIFTVVTAYEGISVAQVVHVDLVLGR